jgi:hypothetical protein
MVNYGANILYNTPDKQMLATDMGSLNYANMVTDITENYTDSLQKEFKKRDKTQNALAYNQPVDKLPVRGMGMSVASNAMGESVSDCQPLIYDRLIYANQKSPLQGAGDAIRGDLPIIYNQPSGWFTPSAASTPQITLRDGALAAMGGVNNESNKQLLALKSAFTAGYQDTGSGINYTVNKSPYVSSAQNDVLYTAFP